MSISRGNTFPKANLNVGDRHRHGDGGEYEYLGGDPTDTVHNWRLVGGELAAQPDTSAWDATQRGARWFYNGNFWGWNGTDIVLLG